jgi:ApaG protein
LAKLSYENRQSDRAAGKRLRIEMIGQTTSYQMNNGLFAWGVTSQNVSVSVIPEFIPERSKPDQYFYAFGYYVSIQNLNQEPIQLLRRSWIITDGSGHTEAVEGEGVIGQQPWIQPGQIFEYSSGCPLRTATGNMRGWYHFQTKKGTRFKARIPLFFLSDTNIRH